MKMLKGDKKKGMKAKGNGLKFKVMLSLYRDYGLEYERVEEDVQGKQNVMYVYCKKDSKKLLAKVNYYEDAKGKLNMVVNREMKKQSI